MLATHEAQVIPVTRTKHFCVFSSSGLFILGDLTDDLGFWAITVGEVLLLGCEDVLFCDDCLLCRISLRAES